jgi:hypothetical protein
MINEELNKSDLRKIKSLIKKEINLFKKKDLESKIKNTVKSNFKDIEDLDKKFDDKVEKITKEVLQAFYDLMYREKYIMKRKVKR